MARLSLVGALQPEHILLVLILVLILFGAGRLPEVFSQLGKGVRTFRDEASGAPPAPPAAPARVCRNCGKPLSDDAKFCANCGQAV